MPYRTRHYGCRTHPERRLTRAASLAVNGVLCAIFMTSLHASEITGASVPAELSEWVRTHAVAVDFGETEPENDEANAINALVGNARVFALGEPAHGGHEPLAYRNRLIRFLIQQKSFTAVSLESGFAQGRHLNDYINGGAGDPIAVARDYLNWGFGDLEANIELLRWLRAYNADPSHTRVRIYGSDVSGGDIKAGLSDARLALDDVTTYFKKSLPEKSAALRKRLASFANRFTPEAYASYSGADRAALSTTLSDASALLETARSLLLTRSSVQEYEWVERELLDSRRVVEIFKVWPAKQFESDLNAALKVSEIRDRTMAEHLLWALAKEGPKGRIVAFAHDSHVAKSTVMTASLFKGLRMPKFFGELLHDELGDDYRVLLSVAATNAPGAPVRKESWGTVEALLAGAGRPQFLIDIRNTSTTSWWGQPQTINAGYTQTRDLVPNVAADAILFLQQISCEPAVRPVATDCRESP